MSIIKIKAEAVTPQLRKQIVWITCGSHMITFHNIDRLPFKIEMASDEELRNPNLVRTVLLEQKKNFAKGKQLRETCIDYVDFANNKFQFVDHNFIRKVFDGKRLLKIYGCSQDMSGLIALFKKIVIKIRIDSFRDISDIKELKSEYIEALCKLGISPVAYEALMQNLMAPLTSDKKGPTLERVLGACRKDDECWRDAFKRFAHEIDFTEDELNRIKSSLRTKTGTIPS